MTDDKLLHCSYCGHRLDRVDHYAIQHTILDHGIYRDVSIADGGVLGEEYGLASETDLRCGYCSEPLPREARAYFFRRWQAALQAAENAPTASPR